MKRCCLHIFLSGWCQVIIESIPAPTVLLSLLCTFFVSPRLPAICSVDWSSRWGRCRPGCASCQQAWPKLWACWTEPDTRPPAGTSGCSGCTRSFPQTVWNRYNTWTEKVVSCTKTKSTTSCFNNFVICVTSHAFCCRVTTLCALQHCSHSVQWWMLTLWSCHTLWCGIIKLKWESKSDTKDPLTLYRRIFKANKPYRQVYLRPHSLSHIQPKSRSDPDISSSPVCCFASCCLYFCWK